MFFKKNFRLLIFNCFCFCGVFCCGQNPIPIIYHFNYGVRFDELRDFVMPSYRNMYDSLMIVDRAKTIYEHFKNKNGVKIFQPETFAQNEDLLKVHSQKYIDSFNELEAIKKIVCFKFNPTNLPGADIFREKVLLPARYAVSGTILGIHLALDSNCKCAINLSGGFHHAGESFGEGFCFFNDIAIAALTALKLLEIKSDTKDDKEKKDLKVLIVDLDAHWGNGSQEILEQNKQIYIFDVFNKDRLFFNGIPSDENDHIFNFPISDGTATEDYLNTVEKNLTSLVLQINPDFIIYIAGFDVLDGDVLGGLKISAEGIIKRDSFVFNLAYQHKPKIPILMLLSGGYTLKSVDVIIESIDKICAALH